MKPKTRMTWAELEKAMRSVPQEERHREVFCTLGGAKAWTVRALLGKEESAGGAVSLLIEEARP